MRVEQSLQTGRRLGHQASTQRHEPIAGSTEPDPTKAGRELSIRLDAVASQELGPGADR